MLKTWVLEPDARLSFRELVEEFAKMARDPGRYLAIPGDKLMRLPSYTPQVSRIAYALKLFFSPQEPAQRAFLLIWRTNT